MLINASDLDTSQPEELVQGMIPRVGAGFLYGPSYWGKSLAALDLALAVANDVPFLGHEVTSGTAVICLGEGLRTAGVRKDARLRRQREDNEAATADMTRFAGHRAAQAFRASLPEYTDERLKIETEPFALPLGHDGQPSPTMRAEIAKLAGLEDLELVILDSFADFLFGESITSETGANRSMAGLRFLSEALDCCVLAVAHPTVKGDKLLGSGRLFYAADFVIAVHPETALSPGSQQSAAFTCEKYKDGEPFEPVSYIIEPYSWTQPATDENGTEIPDAPLITIRTATIRLREDEEAEPALILPDTPAGTSRRRKRTGLRPGAAAITPGGARTARAAFTTAVLKARCPEPPDGCLAVEGASCTKIAPGPDVIALDEAGTLAHPARVAVAIAAGLVTETETDRLFTPAAA